MPLLWGKTSFKRLCNTICETRTFKVVLSLVLYIWKSPRKEVPYQHPLHVPACRIKLPLLTWYYTIDTHICERVWVYSSWVVKRVSFCFRFGLVSTTHHNVLYIVVKISETVRPFHVFSLFAHITHSFTKQFKLIYECKNEYAYVLSAYMYTICFQIHQPYMCLIYKQKRTNTLTRMVTLQGIESFTYGNNNCTVWWNAYNTILK